MRYIYYYASNSLVIKPYLRVPFNRNVNKSYSLQTTYTVQSCTSLKKYSLQVIFALVLQREYQGPDMYSKLTKIVAWA